MSSLKTSFLIEKTDNEHPGCVIGNEALGIYMHDGKPTPLWGPFGTAIRFSRIEDATAVASVLVPQVDTTIVEHSWGINED